MKIGITGANGFVGGHLRKRIENPVIFKGDLKNVDKARNFVKKCDRIYHIAGKNRERLGEVLKNNILATANLIFAMKLEEKYPEIILTSSQQVITFPDLEYGFTKSIEEEIIKKTEKWCIYRIPNVYGPGAKPFYNSVVATFCHQIANNMPSTINEPQTKREFIYVDDLINELLCPEFNTIKSPKGEIISIGELYSLLTDKLGTHKKFEKTLNHYKGEAE
jgi:UDP-2-acetamido-2,6-beta-L-arabino-hexul-4-ose reductase